MIENEMANHRVVTANASSVDVLARTFEEKNGHLVLYGAGSAAVAMFACGTWLFVLVDAPTPL